MAMILIASAGQRLGCIIEIPLDLSTLHFCHSEHALFVAAHKF
jgi:hypothetical protein